MSNPSLDLFQIRVDLENAVGLAYAVEHAMMDTECTVDVYTGAATILRDRLIEITKRLKAYEEAV